jgi:hypothetical protein
MQSLLEQNKPSEQSTEFSQSTHVLLNEHIFPPEQSVVVSHSTQTPSAEHSASPSQSVLDKQETQTCDEVWQNGLSVSVQSSIEEQVDTH